MNREAIKIRKKNELLASSKKHQAALMTELSISSERLVVFGKNMAVIGGALYVSYTVLDVFLEAKLKSEKKKQAELEKRQQALKEALSDPKFMTMEDAINEHKKEL